MKDLDLLVTLQPEFPHFAKFADDKRIAGVRINSAMMPYSELDKQFDKVKAAGPIMPVYFDVKGRQLRITQVHPYPDHLEIDLNHKISCDTPTTVLFKAGEDGAKLEKVVNGNHLIFQGGPYYNVLPGESLHIRHPSLDVHGSIFTDEEIKKIDLAVKRGYKNYCLSYVQGQKDIDEFRELVGKDAFIYAKIEDKKGLNFVANNYHKQANLSLMTACGDLFVEVDRPHHILDAVQMILSKDPTACVGSRILLSVIHQSVPSFSDLAQLGWLNNIGYKKMMLCDELCLKEDLLGRAVNVFDSFREMYAKDKVEYCAPKKMSFINSLKYKFGGK
jgi:hypothetical protein